MIKFNIDECIVLKFIFREKKVFIRDEIDVDEYLFI